MKKQLIATVVGGLILFIWQFLSWALVNVHGKEFTYTANQDKIMELLNQNLDKGEYLLPTAPPNSTSEQQQTIRESAGGKPWASISYHKSLNTNMGMSMFRALVIDLLAVYLLVWLLLQFANLQFQSALLASLAVGVISYLTIPYLKTIWFESSSIAYLIDAVVQWGLVGAWLGWRLREK